MTSSTQQTKNTIETREAEKSSSAGSIDTRPLFHTTFHTSTKRIMNEESVRPSRVPYIKCAEKREKKKMETAAAVYGG